MAAAETKPLEGPTATAVPRVLVVDDSLAVRMDLCEAFAAAGFEPVPCATAREAGDALGCQAVDVIVLDVVLPDADGLDLLRQWRTDARTAAVPILLLSSEAEVADRLRGLRTGADAYVGKPYDHGHVVARARELLPAGRREAAGTATVLVIDDSLTFRERMRAALEAAGHAVVTAATGEDGLREAAARRPAAVLVDGALPGIDGPTVVRRLRLDAALRRTPCLLLTASDGPGDGLRALDAGADAFVRKDEELAFILARLASLLRASSSPATEGASALAPKRVLAVGAGADPGSAIAEGLRHEGYDVARARSVEEALDLLSAQPVHCILADAALPAGGALDLCRRLKEAPPLRDVPLILLTAADDGAAAVAALAAGADDCVAATSGGDLLKARVAAQLRRRQLGDEARRARAELFQRELDATETRAVRRIAESRAALVSELERKNQELEAFSYSVSHDLRAPLRAIDGFSRLLAEEHAAALDAEGLDYLDRVRGAARRMGELIDHLMELSRVGRMELERAPVDLSALARAVGAELAAKAPAPAVLLVVEDTPPVEVDRRLLRVALENLLGNAWKFSAKAEAPRVVFSGSASDGVLRYAVSDNGAGFRMQYAGRLFQPFQRLHTEAEFPGTGVGLATVHRIIDRHGGRIWAESEPGRGATFHFTLPL
jgi:DNA-binding response OmpR family regulator